MSKINHQEIIYLEYLGAEFDLFFEITRPANDRCLEIRSGYIGYSARKQYQCFDTVAIAQKSAETMLENKLKEGYIRAIAGHRPKRDLPTISIDEWVREFIVFYRGLGFFEKQADLSDERLTELILSYGDGEDEYLELIPEIGELADDIDSLEEFFADDHLLTTDTPEYKFLGVNTLVSNPTTDLRFLALLDSDRLWWRWREFQENNYPAPITVDYQVFLQQLSHISRGVFMPENISISAQPNYTDIEFSYHDHIYQIKAHTTTVEYYANQLQIVPYLRILEQINEIMSNYSDHRFIYFEISNKDLRGSTHYVPFNGTAYIMVLTSSEMQEMQQKRGINFV
jgi:predicted DNA-binding WGR domain protein